MWVSFSGGYPFAIKLYVGGVNAVSGLPYKETGITKARRAMLRATSKSIQDYMATPSQLWLDGIASGDGTVRQFVAMPMGEGYSIEAQITGQEIVGGLQFEVTPAIVAITKQCPKPPRTGNCAAFCENIQRKYDHPRSSPLRHCRYIEGNNSRSRRRATRSAATLMWRLSPI